MSVGDPEWAERTERTPPPALSIKKKKRREREGGVPNPYILLRFRK